MSFGANLKETALGGRHKSHIYVTALAENIFLKKKKIPMKGLFCSKLKRLSGMPATLPCGTPAFKHDALINISFLSAERQQRGIGTEERKKQPARKFVAALVKFGGLPDGAVRKYEDFLIHMKIMSTDNTQNGRAVRLFLRNV